MTDLSSLAARVERLDGPDQELDVRIHFALHPDQLLMIDAGGVKPPTREPKYCKLSEFSLDQWGDWEGLAIIVQAAAVTQSLDAAMQLVPEGWWLESMSDEVSATPKGIAVIGCACTLAGIEPEIPNQLTREVSANAATRPLALTSAALKARARVREGE